MRRRTLANLTHVPPALVEGMRTLLKGGVVMDCLDDWVSIVRPLPHGHVQAVLGMCRQLGLERVLHRQSSRERCLALALIVSRVIRPASKLATARALSPETADSSLGRLLGLEEIKGNELLAVLDWLRARQRWIERGLARRHPGTDTLILYDVSSSYLEGRCCPLAAFGHDRDGKRGKRRILFGLLCAPDGCPVAVEVFPGNRSDPSTVATQVEKTRRRFGIRRLVLVGDRGMITSTRIREDLKPADLDWISALRYSSIRKLAQTGSGDQAPLLDPGQLIEDRVAELSSPDFPDERLLVCLNPRLRQNRRRKRHELLDLTEARLEAIAAAVHRPRRPLRSVAAISRRVERELHRMRMQKHFQLTITEGTLTWSRDLASIAEEAQLDGIYVVRTSLRDMGADQAVEACQSLAKVEWALPVAQPPAAGPGEWCR